MNNTTFLTQFAGPICLSPSNDQQLVFVLGVLYVVFMFSLGYAFSLISMKIESKQYDNSGSVSQKVFLYFAIPSAFVANLLVSKAKKGDAFDSKRRQIKKRYKKIKYLVTLFFIFAYFVASKETNTSSYCDSPTFDLVAISAVAVSIIAVLAHFYIIYTYLFPKET